MKNKKYTGKRHEQKKVVAFLMVLLTAMLSVGCGNGEPAEEKTGEHPGNVAVSEEAEQESGEKAATANESEAGPIPLYQGTYKSSILQEDGNYYYLCGSCRISKVDKTTGAEQVLWENPEEVSGKNEYLYANGGGLLLGDRIYFIERWYEDNWSVGRAFSCVNTDGSGYEQIAKLSESRFDSLLLMDGMLYIDDLDREVFYQVFKDGTLSASDEILLTSENRISYMENGERLLFQQEMMEEFPVDTEQKSISELIGFKDYNSKYFLCFRYEDKIRLVLVDRRSMDGNSSATEKVIYEQDEYYDVLGMDEEYVYIVTNVYEENGIGRSYERILLETGECEVIYVQEPSGLRYDPVQLMDVVIEDGYIYYVDVQDYIYYLMRRKTDGTGEGEKILKEGIFDTGIREVGTLQSIQKEVYSKLDSEVLIYEINLNRLKVDEKYPGAQLINTYLLEHQNTLMAIAEQNKEEIEQMAAELGYYAMNYSIESDFGGFEYSDSHYISFVQKEYEYTGGAHGMPFWVGFTFDLQTGERLLITDIVNNSEEELKEIVSGYFAEMINKDPEVFWQDAVDTVYETVNNESDFYLTEEGIVFYYGPYDLASYAAGFQQVTIPYEEFDMAAILDKVAQ